jgi:DNA-binding GntR family transcriptional regulator
VSVDSTIAIPELEQPASISDLLANRRLDSDSSLAAQVFSLLKEIITTVKLYPGQMISEKEVAETLNASKTPVREALIRLQGIGLVTIVPKSGTYVTPIQITRYIEACFIRLQLEVGAVRRAAAEQNSWESILKMESILQQQITALETGADLDFFRLDQALHEAFFTAARITGVWNVVKDSQADVNRIRHLKRLHNIRREGEVIKEHKAIVDAIRQGSPDAAEIAMVKHIGSLEQEVEELASHTDLLNFIEVLNNSSQRNWLANTNRAG